MIRSILLSIILITIPFSALPAEMPDPVSLDTTIEQDKGDITKKLLAPCIIVALCTLIWLTTPDEYKPALLDQIRPHNLTLNFLQEYSRNFIATLAHEYGHNIAQYSISGNSGAIHVGSSSVHENHYLTLGNLHLDGFNPLQGRTERVLVDNQKKIAAVHQFIDDYCNKHNLVKSQLTQENSATIIKSPEFKELQQSLIANRFHLALFLLAGGLTGALTNQLITAGSGKGFRPDGITLYHLINALLPFDEDNDAAVLWRDCLHIPKPIIASVITLAPLIEISGEIMCSYIDPQKAPHAKLDTVVLIGLLNYFTRGYLRFHA